MSSVCFSLLPQDQEEGAQVGDAPLFPLSAVSIPHQQSPGKTETERTQRSGHRTVSPGKLLSSVRRPSRQSQLSSLVPRIKSGTYRNICETQGECQAFYYAIDRASYKCICFCFTGEVKGNLCFSASQKCKSGKSLGSKRKTHMAEQLQSNLFHPPRGK